MATFLSMPRAVEAFQFTGPGDIPALQAFMAPASPAYAGEGRTLHVLALDRNSMKTYPSLGRQFAYVTVHAGSWVIKEADGFVVLTDEEMRRQYDVPEPVAEIQAADL